MQLAVWQWVILALCAFGIGLSKGGFNGIGILPIAVFALVVPARISVGVVLPLLICGDCVSVTLFRRHAVWTHLQRLMPWAALGIVAGFLLLYRLQTGHYDADVVNRQVGRMIGSILVILVGLHVWRSRQSANQPDDGAPVVPQNSWQVVGVGIVAGFATMVANASGPIMVIYFLAMRLPKMEFIGTAAWFFLVLNLFKLPFMSMLHLINGSSLIMDAQLAPGVVAGVLVGRKIIPYVDQKLFEKLALALTLLAALRMLQIAPPHWPELGSMPPPSLDKRP